MTIRELDIESPVLWIYISKQLRALRIESKKSRRKIPLDRPGNVKPGGKEDLGTKKGIAEEVMERGL